MGKYLFFSLIMALLFISSCSTETGMDTNDENEPTDQLMSTFSSINTLVLSKRCAKSGCHLDSINPILSSNEAYANIVGKINGERTLNYIEPGQPDRSYLFQKIISSGNRSGARMPFDGASRGYLSDAEIDSIRAWITAGAKNN